MTMDLTLKRIARRDTYTIGRLYVDGVYFCDTIEDKDRGLKQSLPASVNKAMKKAGATAIPTGKYQVTLKVKSQRFSKKKQYDFCGGFVPRLINVPAFEGVLIHVGNTAKDTEGCILVGRNIKVGKVLDSGVTFRALYAKLKEAKGYIYITIE
jgi:hypothetical protein